MGGIGSGRKKKPGRVLRDAIEEINIEEILSNLQDWAKGKPVICPNCGKDTLACTADTVALQSAIELLNRKLGKPIQKSISLSASIQLSGDDCDELAERFGIAKLWELKNKGLLPEGDIVDAEYKEVV